MRLNVGKNSLWVCYSLLNPSIMNYLIPPHLEIARVSPLKGIPAQEMLLFNAYELKSRWMNGARLDIQTFARDKESGSAHLVVLDVLSNTRSWDPLNGITPANCIVNIEDAHGVDLKFEGETKKFSVVANNKETRSIDYTFCVEANKKCFFKNFKKGFELNFQDEEIMQSVTELKDVQISNSCWEEFRGEVITVFKHNQPMKFDVVKLNPFEFM